MATVDAADAADAVDSGACKQSSCAVSPPSHDPEKQDTNSPENEHPGEAKGLLRSLNFLDRFLAVWIFLAMLVGILLGNFVDDVGPALQKGTFVDVSIPIGMLD